MFPTLEEAAEQGAFILGAADDVRAAIARQIEELGINYMILGFYFGTLPHANAMWLYGPIAAGAASVLMSRMVGIRED